MGFVIVRGTSGTVPRPCHRSCSELEFPSPVLIWVAQSICYVCVEGNVIYSLVASVIIFLRNIFLAVLICMYDTTIRFLFTSIFLYACESWTLTAELQRRIQAVEMGCYR